jgi:hypothetical protein
LRVVYLGGTANGTGLSARLLLGGTSNNFHGARRVAGHGKRTKAADGGGSSHDDLGSGYAGNGERFAQGIDSIAASLCRL